MTPQHSFWTEWRLNERSNLLKRPLGDDWNLCILGGVADDELVRQVQAHGKAVHNQDVSREDALAMAQPAD